MSNIKRDAIFWGNLDPAVSSEIKKKRPAIIISNDIGNVTSRRIIVAPITSKASKIYPFELSLQVNGIHGCFCLSKVRYFAAL